MKFSLGISGLVSILLVFSFDDEPKILGPEAHPAQRSRIGKNSLYKRILNFNYNFEICNNIAKYNLLAHFKQLQIT